MNEKTYILPESLRNALLQYLETRPYSEVAQGIAALTSLQEQAKTDAPNAAA
jgi:hypothetical protein